MSHVSLPRFAPDDDPGPDFVGLARRAGLGTPELPLNFDDVFTPTHATTVLGLRYAGGVVIAGDRRATAGNLISHRRIEKVFPADRHSAVAIAGAAGPASEMVRLFQLQLEHYEKVEGRALSLDGKANQLAQMLRQNLPAAMQGLAVVPIFAGYDHKRELGRLFRYDVTGGRYEEENHVESGSGSLHASTVLKLMFHPNMSAEEAIDLVIEALFQAADEDSATGGPDLVRGIFPIIATIDADGFTEVHEDDIRARTEAFIDRLESERERQ